MSKKVNLLNLSPEQMKAFFVEIGEKPFRSTQIVKWIHQFLVDDFDQMSNVSKSLREKLKEIAEIKAPEIVSEQLSNDGTVKWALKLESGQAIEMVYIPERERGTLCVSSQVGCALECSFCSTAQQGFNRNLSLAEIIGQVWIAARQLGALKTTGTRKVTNVVMMGMGEPLLNFDNVVNAMNLMMNDNAYGLSKRRVTLSTSGVLPALDRLLDHTDVAIAISLHAPIDSTRDILVPINKKYPIKQLLESTNRYLNNSAAAKKATIEYVMLDGINDSDADARAMVKLLSNTPCKINLIPFNTFPGTDYQTSSDERIDRFNNILQNAGFTVVVRRTRGDDIDAACGQLAGKVNDRTKRKSRRESDIPVKSVP